MRILLNIIWLVLSGLGLFLGYVLAGIVLCVLIVTIPWGLASFRIGAYASGRSGARSCRGPRRHVVVPRQRRVGDRGRLVARARAHRLRIALCITIIGIPMAIADFKLIPVSLAPLGKEIVPLPRD